MNKNLEFLNKTVLVTGGSKGIGRAICIKFAELGAKVFFTYRKNDKSSSSLKLMKFLGGGKIFGIKNTSISEKSIYSVMKKIKRERKELNVLVNNIGDAIKRSSFIKSNDKLWIDNLNINLISSVRTTRIFLKMFESVKNASIVNIGSIAGKMGGSGDSLHYASSKAALHIFTKGLSKELKGIRVNCVAPSIINTNFQKRLSSKKRLKKIISSTPLKRIGAPEEVSNTVTFLSSDKASYINGEVIFVSGGR